MTNKEAIEQLKHMKVFIGYDAENPMVKEMQSALDLAIKALEQQPNRCDSCVHSEEQDGSNCYECVKGMADNFETQPTDADCISRQMVNELVDELARAISDERCCISRGRSTATIMQDILNLPSVTPTRPKGKWKILDECANEGVYCSKCHKTVFKLEFSHTMKWRNFKYCPNCGARMEVEK